MTGTRIDMVNVLTNELTLADGTVVSVPDANHYRVGSTVEDDDRCRKIFDEGGTVYAHFSGSVPFTKETVGQLEERLLEIATKAARDTARGALRQFGVTTPGFTSGVSVRARDDIEDIRRNGFGDRIYSVRGALLSDEEKRRVLPRDHACHPDNAEDE